MGDSKGMHDNTGMEGGAGMNDDTGMGGRSPIYSGTADYPNFGGGNPAPDPGSGDVTWDQVSEYNIITMEI